MGRQPSRASGVKALQAIKETSTHGRGKIVKKQEALNSENPPAQSINLKRSSSPGSIVLPSAKRNALGDVTNCVQQQAVTKVTLKALAVQKTAKQQTRASEVTFKPGTTETVKPDFKDLSVSVDTSQSSSSSACKDTPVTQVQNFLKAASLEDVSLRSEESLTYFEEETTEHSSQNSQETLPTQLWKDIDKAEAKDPLFSSEYAPEIYEHMRMREEHFTIPAYMPKQTDIHSNMRTILVDWLIEVQENFELFHETLYLAVKLVDLYLSKKEVKREYLQLVGATSMLIASKFEELSPPLVDDFLYLCDDAYTHEELLTMEREILKTVDYDINIPVAYRFIRRLAKAADANMETHTLARYISESTLQEYQFVTEKPSMMAAASMYLALRMKKLGGWNPTLQHYSGYTVTQMIPLVTKLNTLIQTPLGTTQTVRSKYSHEVFFQVATTPPLVNVSQDAQETLLECPTVPESM